MPRSNKCSVCKNDYVDEIDQIYIETNKNVKRVIELLQERFPYTEAAELTYSSVRRHFLNKHEPEVLPTNIRPISEESLEDGEDLTQEEEDELRKSIKDRGLDHLSADEIIKNARRNKKVNLEYAARLEALIPNIEMVYNTAENDKIRLDALKQHKETIMAINKLKTDYIQIDIKAKDAAEKNKDELSSGIDEELKKTLISFARITKREDMFKIREKEVEKPNDSN